MGTKGWLGWLMVMGIWDLQAAELFTHQVLQMGAHRLSVEVAQTPASRQQGLMARTHLPESNGMLFVFSEEARHCLWMKNTLIPLSAVFLDEEGYILNQVALEPHNLASLCSDGPSRFALEVNQGWFERHAVDLRQPIKGLPRIKN